LIFVILYIIAVFGWWLYSFIHYNNEVYNNEKKVLDLKARLIQHELTDYLDKVHDQNSGLPIYAYRNNKKEIQKMHADLNQYHGINTELHLKDTNSPLESFFQVRASEYEYKSIQKEFLKKGRAFYSEVIFFTILVISGVVWVFSKLESLLNLNKMQNNFLL